MTILQTQQSTHTNSTQPVIGVLLVHGLNGNTGDMAELQDVAGSWHSYQKHAPTWSW